MSVFDEPRGHGASSPTFPVDERLIMPESRYEVIDGEVVYVSPADTAHGSRHSKLSALLEAHVADGFDAASDMLTRTSEKGDMAPDGSVYPVAPDPETGGRQLEQLAFEVVSTESIAHAGRKAAALIERGVRRVFAIDVERQRALEWSVETDAWRLLGSHDAIDDPALVIPLPIDALVGAVKADDAVAHALIAKGNPRIAEAQAEAKAEGKAEGWAEGKAEGKAEALLAVLAARSLEPSPDDEARIRRASAAELDRWLVAALRATSISQVFTL